MFLPLASLWFWVFPDFCVQLLSRDCVFVGAQIVVSSYYGDSIPCPLSPNPMSEPEGIDSDNNRFQQQTEANVIPAQPAQTHEYSF